MRTIKVSKVELISAAAKKPAKKVKKIHTLNAKPEETLNAVIKDIAKFMKANENFQKLMKQLKATPDTKLFTGLKKTIAVHFRMKFGKRK